MKKSPKYITRFDCVAQCLVPSEVDKYLAKASLENLKSLLPEDIDFESNPDIIPIVANGTVVNRGNKNGHLIDTKTALLVAKNFKYKFLDIEHKRDIIVGAVTDVGFSEFGSSELLASEDIGDTQKPFNLSVSGIVYRLVRPAFAKKLLESNDPSSEYYNKISLSWEIGHDEYHLLIGGPNIEDGKIITDPQEIASYDKYLRKNGGKNKLEDGTPIYMILTGENVFPIGFGFTMNPAADVQGIYIGLESTLELNQEKESKQDVNDQTEENIKNNSQIKQPCVKQLETKFNMKIASIEELITKWEEVKASLSPTEIRQFIEDSLKDASTEWSKKVSEKENAVATLQAQNENLVKEVSNFKLELENTKKTLTELQEAAAKQASEGLFQARMNAIDSEFELDAEETKIVVAELKKISTDEEFASWLNTFKVLAKEKNKTYKASLVKAKEDEKKQITAEVKASVEEALKNAQNVSTTIPNSSEPTTSIKDKFKNMLKKDNLEITK